MAEHTKLPWAAEPEAGRGAWIAGADGEWAALSCGNTDESARANTAFIVKACNAHEALVAAIHEACDLLAERTHGNAARSPGHNARLCLENALKSANLTEQLTSADRATVGGEK